jgi:hypothetical protein
VSNLSERELLLAMFHVEYFPPNTRPECATVALPLIVLQNSFWECVQNFLEALVRSS